MRFKPIHLRAVATLTVLSACTLASECLSEESQNLKDIPYGVMSAEMVRIAYSGTEKLKYAISWTGGVKIGELHMEIHRDKDEGYELDAYVTTEGTFMNSIYPVHDTHTTRVRGDERLPYFYEVYQEEGYSYTAYRMTTYDQEKGVVKYRKNDQPVREFKIDGTSHNEFSAFFASRLMEFKDGGAIIVPAFADKKRAEVVVKTLSRQMTSQTVLGDVQTVLVSPILKFKGLYDKRGDTVIWYTDDECRVPVQINSKVVVGSITAKLVSYENPLCPRYTTTKSVSSKKEDEAGG
ncbi:DUF3108 domain-containing protein [Desulfopila sp. IMCC35008]|uniref:DUF3108 domain-containing protein n=1 Tax=Desulfopila sp. IMCC35008 TaxID=2653858 RepID=UPI0013D0E332|nr:DUF3108 domain-containing protein [Desulfopila sp. IMCC35008]